MNRKRDKAYVNDMLNVIGNVWKLNPELRLGQLLHNAILERPDENHLYKIEDDDLCFRLGMYVGQLHKKKRG